MVSDSSFEHRNALPCTLTSPCLTDGECEWLAQPQLVVTRCPSPRCTCARFYSDETGVPQPSRLPLGMVEGYLANMALLDLGHRKDPALASSCIG